MLLGRSREDLGLVPLASRTSSERGPEPHPAHEDDRQGFTRCTSHTVLEFCMILPVPGWEGWQGWLQAPSLEFAVSIRIQDE